MAEPSRSEKVDRALEFINARLGLPPGSHPIEAETPESLRTLIAQALADGLIDATADGRLTITPAGAQWFDRMTDRLASGDN